MEGGPQVNITELRAYVASNEYGAELALQHAMRLLAGMEQERALADRLAEAIERHEKRGGFTPQRQAEALAAWRRTGQQSTPSVVPTNSAETTQDVETRR
jgi:hypothetical protein